MFTADTKLRSIFSDPAFRGRRYMCGEFPAPLGFLTGFLSLKGLAEKVGPWNPDSMEEGMDYLRERALSGRVFYDIYTKEERKADPSKRKTGLAALTLKKKAPFVVVIAGGGYSMVCSMIEAYPVIQALNQMGYAAFSLQYRCGKDAAAPHPQEDLARAVRFIMDHADELNVESQGYAVMGFSAGGHLAACMGTDRVDCERYGIAKPAALILSHPVITIGEKTHAGSRDLLLGKRPGPELIRAYSIEKQVTDSYSPSFIWQYDQDDTVPIENTILLTEALEKNGVDFEYLTFPGTVHGAGLGRGTACEGWLEMAVSFWEAHRSAAV